MEAWIVQQWGPPEVMHRQTWPTPKPGTGEVLVRVTAIGVNPLDTKIRAGLTPWLNLSPPIVLGCEGVGIIEALGSDCGRWAVGQRVCSLASSRLGWQSTHAILPIADIGLVPDEFDDVTAAALPVAYLTAVQALDQAGVVAGSRLLVQGGGGAVGSIALQLAHSRGASTYATGSAGNIDYIRSLGVERAIDYGAERFEDAVPILDAVLCTVGGDVQQRSLQCLRPGGRLVSIESRPDAEEALRFGAIATLCSARSDGAMLDSLGPIAAEGSLKPRIAEIFSFKEAVAAHVLVESGGAKGKVIIKL